MCGEGGADLPRCLIPNLVTMSGGAVLPLFIIIVNEAVPCTCSLLRNTLLIHSLKTCCFKYCFIIFTIIIIITTCYVNLP